MADASEQRTQNDIMDSLLEPQQQPLPSIHKHKTAEIHADVHNTTALYQQQQAMQSHIQSSQPIKQPLHHHELQNMQTQMLDTQALQPQATQAANPYGNSMLQSYSSGSSMPQQYTPQYNMDAGISQNVNPAINANMPYDSSPMQQNGVQQEDIERLKHVLQQALIRYEAKKQAQRFSRSLSQSFSQQPYALAQGQAQSYTQNQTQSQTQSYLNALPRQNALLSASQNAYNSSQQLAQYGNPAAYLPVYHQGSMSQQAQEPKPQLQHLQHHSDSDDVSFAALENSYHESDGDIDNDYSLAPSRSSRQQSSAKQRSAKRARTTSTIQPTYVLGRNDSIGGFWDGMFEGIVTIAVALAPFALLAAFAQDFLAQWMISPYSIIFPIISFIVTPISARITKCWPFHCSLWDRLTTPQPASKNR